jgi:hypothetical protein
VSPLKFFSSTVLLKTLSIHSRTASRHNTKSFASPGGTSNAVPAKLEASSYGMLEYEEVGHQKQLAVLICSVVGLFWG